MTTVDYFLLLFIFVIPLVLLLVLAAFVAREVYAFLRQRKEESQWFTLEDEAHKARSRGGAYR